MFKKALVVGLVLAGLVEAQTDTVQVVAASDLQFALTEIATIFEKQNPNIKIQLNFGSSGKIFTQITQGLPADIFMSADESFPKQLENQGQVLPDSLKQYAVGRMVIWVSNSLVAQGLDPTKMGPKILLDPRITQVAVANPVHAPYGRAGVSLLEHFGFLRNIQKAQWEDMTAGIPAYYDVAALKRGKKSFEFIYGENISQTAQISLTSTGVGLIALSVAISPAMQAGGKYWLAPLSSHLRLNQTYVVLQGQGRPAVLQFYNFVGSSEAHKVLRKYGFLLPGDKLE